MKNFICSCISIVLLTTLLPAQNSDAEIFRDRTRTPLACVWSSTAMYETPGKGSRYLGPVTFGEEVTRAGRKAYVGSEKRTYIEVYGPGGQLGWVYDYHFVNNGMAAVVQTRSRLYHTPRARSSRSADYFAAGEMVIMGNASGDWLELYGKDKMKLGWIEGIDRVSASKDDLLAAEETQKAGARPYTGNTEVVYEDDDQYDYQSRGNAVRSSTRNKRTSRNPNRFRGEVVGNLNALLASRAAFSSSKNRTISPGMSSFDQSPEDRQIRRETVVDPRTGKLRSQITQTGKLYLINFQPNPEKIFEGYHKTLPVGSKVAISFPDNAGFVEIEIIGTLSSQREEVLGLYPECVKIIYGEMAPNTIQFTYSDKK